LNAIHIRQEIRGFFCRHFPEFGKNINHTAASKEASFGETVNRLLLMFKQKLLSFPHFEHFPRHSPSVGSVLGIGGVNDGISFPVKVEQLQIISRSLENKDGADVLK